MHRYIGLDAHASSCTLVVLSAAGKKVKEMVVETHGQALVEAVRLVPGNRHLVLEEGTQSAWLYEILERHVDELVVVPVGSSKGQKSDRIDAYNLAEALRIGGARGSVRQVPPRFRIRRRLPLRPPSRKRSASRRQPRCCDPRPTSGVADASNQIPVLPAQECPVGKCRHGFGLGDGFRSGHRHGNGAHRGASRDAATPGDRGIAEFPFETCDSGPFGPSV